MSSPAPARSIAWVHIALIFIAALCFILAFFKVGVGGFDLIPLGLFFFALGFLPWWG